MIFMPNLYLVKESDKKPALKTWRTNSKKKKRKYSQVNKPWPSALRSACTGLYAIDINY